MINFPFKKMIDNRDSSVVCTVCSSRFSIAFGAQQYMEDLDTQKRLSTIPVSYTHLDVYKRQA